MYETPCSSVLYLFTMGYIERKEWTHNISKIIYSKLQMIVVWVGDFVLEEGVHDAHTGYLSHASFESPRISCDFMEGERLFYPC